MERGRRGPSSRGEGRFIRQSGPIGRFAHVVLEVQCLGTPEPLSVSWEVAAEAIPHGFRHAVERGIVGLFELGARYGEFSGEGISVRVVGGTCHPTDSNEASFEMAAAAAFVNAVSGSPSRAMPRTALRMAGLPPGQRWSKVSME